jgi:transcriptional regulator with XRE-family HTH domain
VQLKKRNRRPNSADIELGESIRARRLIAGMSQSDLAGRLGVSFQQVQKYEKGTNRVGAGRLPQIAEIFDIPIGALFDVNANTLSRREQGYRSGQAPSGPQHAQTADRVQRHRASRNPPLPHRVDRYDRKSDAEEAQKVKTAEASFRLVGAVTPPAQQRR